MDKKQAMQEYVDGLLKAAEGLPPSAEKVRLVNLLTPKKRNIRDTLDTPTTTPLTHTHTVGTNNSSSRTNNTATALFQTPDYHSGDRMAAPTTATSTSTTAPIASPALSLSSAEPLGQLIEREAQLSMQMDEVRDAVLSESLRVGRLEKWLQQEPHTHSAGSEAEPTASVTREVVAALLAVEQKLDQTKKERDAFYQVGRCVTVLFADLINGFHSRVANHTTL
jgi:hypothetical protein